MPRSFQSLSMMKNLLLFCCLFFISIFISAQPVESVFDPQTISNNKFGIHIIDENDLEDAAKLVNSSGGDWGYVKIVIREDDRKLDKWQEIFNKMRRLHLIPIIRLATKVEDEAWVKPRVDDIGSWVDFLDQLNWVTENRYVVIFNEPNHAKEWGNEINPEEYAWYLKEFSQRLKKRSADFFILPAGLDASAPDDVATMDSFTFLNRMIAKEPDVLNFIDGWSTHSYPNPGFLGKPWDAGKMSINGFAHEQKILEKYDKDDLPIFILETGWMHSDGKYPSRSFPTPETVANYYIQAFSQIWNKRNIVAVVPFLLNYQDIPFDRFSWKKVGSNEFNAIFATVQNLPKNKGEPKQKHNAYFINLNFPLQMVVDSSYTVPIEIENAGQSIISSKEGWKLELSGLTDFQTTSSDIEAIDPGHRTRVSLFIDTPKKTAKYAYKLQLKKDEQVITEYIFDLILVPPPALLVEAKLWLQKRAQGNDFSFLIYDNDEKILYESKNVTFENGQANIDDLHNVVPNQTYRLVLTKPYYLPRQVIVTIPEIKTGITFPPLLPLDPSNDGKLSNEDLDLFFKHPFEIMRMFMIL